jgi:hypothetical protein
MQRKKGAGTSIPLSLKTAFLSGKNYANSPELPDAKAVRLRLFFCFGVLIFVQLQRHSLCGYHVK